MVIRFEPSDLELFSRASHDHNSLHTSASYARRTPFGQPLVVGVLGLLAAAQSIENPNHTAVSRISASFRNPILTGIGYSVTAEPRGADQIRLTIRDCGTVI